VKASNTLCTNPTISTRELQSAPPNSSGSRIRISSFSPLDYGPSETVSISCIDAVILSDIQRLLTQIYIIIYESSLSDLFVLETFFVNTIWRENQFSTFVHGCKRIDLIMITYQSYWAMMIQMNFLASKSV
jgi:hypothetical protein